MEINKVEQTLQIITANKIMPMYYHDEYLRCLDVVLACCEAGVNVFEFTNRGKNSYENFSRLKDETSRSYPTLKLGIGTIFNLEQARRFEKADFIVQPICDASVANFCEERDILWIPGVMTINEIYQAVQLSAKMIKVFPAAALGKSYIKAIKGPMPDIKIMVTGGIKPFPDEVKSWLDAGAVCCGLGSQLFELSSEKNKIIHQLNGIKDKIKCQNQ